MNCKKKIKYFKGDISKEFEMCDICNISYSIGIKLYKSSRGRMMHQRRYAKRFGMEECNATSTPVEPRLQLSKDSDEDDVDQTQYRRLIRSLRYFCHTRPDLAYNVGMIVRFMQKPKVSHLATTKRMLRYLRGTLDYEILFPINNEGKECKLVDYTDSSWCGDAKDRKE